MSRDAERAQHNAERFAQGQLAAKIAGIASQASTARATGFRVPIVDEDPAPDFPANLWLFNDGRLRWRDDEGNVHELRSLSAIPPSLSSAPSSSTGINIYRDSTSDELRVRRPDGTWARYVSATATSGGTDTAPPSGGTSSTPRPPDPTPTKKRLTMSPTWARLFCSSHGIESGGDMHYGHFAGSAHGDRRIMLGFDDALARTLLAGAEIRAVEIHMLNTDSWAHAGIDVHFGAHNKAAAPGAFSAVRRNAFVNHWPEVGDGAFWRGAPRWYGRALRDNQIKGLTIEQPAGNAYYGEMRWNSVRLRVTYVS